MSWGREASDVSSAKIIQSLCRNLGVGLSNLGCGKDLDGMVLLIPYSFFHYSGITKDSEHEGCFLN